MNNPPDEFETAAAPLHPNRNDISRHLFELRWNRSRHEILLIGTRGSPVCPAPGTQWDSAIMSPRLAHSESSMLPRNDRAVFSKRTKDRIELSRQATSRMGCVGQRSRGGGRMRRVLPQRRAAETFDLRFWSQLFTVTVGFYADGTPGEVFIDGGKTGQDVQTTARDAAVVLSLALQHGSSIETIRHAVTRGGSGAAASILGGGCRSMRWRFYRGSSGHEQPAR